MFTTTPGTGEADGTEAYADAIYHIRATYDGESIDATRSSWITSAEYFKAGSRGYLILGIRGDLYILEGVPPDVWKGFKDAPSLGEYYQRNIRGKYGPPGARRRQ